MLAAAGTSASHAEATSRLVGRQCARRSSREGRGKRDSPLVNLACNEATCVGNGCALTVSTCWEEQRVGATSLENSHCLPIQSAGQ